MEKRELVYLCSGVILSHLVDMNIRLGGISKNAMVDDAALVSRSVMLSELLYSKVFDSVDINE